MGGFGTSVDKDAYAILMAVYSTLPLHPVEHDLDDYKRLVEAVEKVLGIDPDTPNEEDDG